jgi:ribosomal protein S12 methylthiotransferase accessory factor
MEINISYLGNQKINANFNGFDIIADQPISNHGENTAPSPFDYFLASTVLCAGYYVKAYCDARKISLDGIKISQVNTKKDPENKFKQTLEIKIIVPENFSQKDRDGIMRSVEGCSVKKAIQQNPDFVVSVLT